MRSPSFVAAAVVAALAGCGATQSGGSGLSPSECSESETVPRRAGECCGGGMPGVACAEGLTCYRRYRNPGSIGTCMPPQTSATETSSNAPVASTDVAPSSSVAPASCRVGAWCEVGRLERGLAAVHATSTGELWTVGDDTRVRRFRDGAWSGDARRLLAGENRIANLLDIQGIDEGPVFGVGTDGIVLQLAPTDARVASGVEADLLAVLVVSAREAYAVGNGGVITAWNGERWTAERSPTRERLHALARLGDVTFVAGENGTVLERAANGPFRAHEGAPGGSFRAAAAAESALYLGTDRGTVARFDGTRWTEETTTVAGPIEAMAGNADVGVWAASSHRLSRRDPSGRWEDAWSHGRIVDLAAAGPRIVVLDDDGATWALSVR